MEWVSRVLAIVFLMLAPGLFGQWLDARWGTEVLGLLGFAIGLTLGITSLVTMTKSPQSDSTKRPRSTNSDSNRHK